MFGKIFTQIYASSIAEDWTVRTVFQDMIILADLNGVVDITPEFLSRTTKVPINVVTKAISELEKPDPRSRSPKASGARIVRLDEHRDWGWLIVNYEEYRSIASEEQRRLKTKERVDRFRLKHKKLEKCNAPVTLGNACNAMQRERERDKESVPATTPVPPPVVEVALPERGGGVVGNFSLGKIDWLKERLEELYNRPKGRRWGCEEEHLLVEISKRPDHKEELRLIKVFRPKVPPRSFPQSLSNLLKSWDSTVDRARNVPTYEDKVPQLTIAQKDHQAAMRRIAQL